MNAILPIRTLANKRMTRWTIVSAALDLFKARKANLARRDRWEADRMRFAGEEAAFCLAEVRARIAYDERTRAAEESIRRSKEDLISRMTPEQREAAMRDVLNQLATLDYLPLYVNLKSRREQLQDELAMLRAEPDYPREVTDPAKLGLIEAVRVALQVQA